MNATNYHWDFGPVLHDFPALVRGLEVTLALSGASIAIGTPIGIGLGCLLTVRLRVVRIPLAFLTDAIRALPALITILIVYYYLPILFNEQGLSAFTLATIAMAINLAAFVADVVRASIERFPRGLIEAALACGMSARVMLRRVILPETVREILPTLALLYIDIIKLSSLASVIAVNELLHTADRIRSQTFDVMEVFAVIAIMYLVVIMPLAAAARALERSPKFRRRS